MKFYNYLNEKTFNIGVDVDYIYNKFFKKFINDFKKGNYPKGNNDISFGAFTSNILKSKKSKKAHKLNPITIQAGIFNKGSYYSPNLKSMSFSINKNAFDVINIYSGDMNKIKQALALQYNSWKSEFKEISIKGTIYHELSHWLNDTFHNQNIKKRIDRATELDDITILTKKYVNFTDFEIDAQIHAIKQIKRMFNKTWNEITWLDIIQYKPSFGPIFRHLKTSSNKDTNDYMKHLFKRLNRENLLGKKMETTFLKAIKGI